LIEALQEEGLGVLPVADGGDVPAIAREQRPDVVVVDRQLPNSSGLDVLDALHNDPATRDLPILLTGRTHPDSLAGPPAVRTVTLDVDLFVEQVWRLLKERLQANWHPS
jgi:CheY-like chemotaxis protein